MDVTQQPKASPTPLAASLLLTAMASIGTGVLWNGLPFIARIEYGFGKVENLLLYLLIGVVYVAGSLTASAMLRWLGERASSRAVLTLILAVQSLTCALPLVADGPWIIWMTGGVISLCSAWLWPIVESYLVSGRHGQDMRRAIGWWNIIWMVATAGAMFAIAPLMDQHASLAIVALGGASMLGTLALPWYGQSPAHHDEHQAKTVVPLHYPQLLRGARLLLPLSYGINGVLAALLPFLLASLEVPIPLQTPLAATWMLSRLAATTMMWKWPHWHGRWSLLFAAAIAMATGFGLVAAAGNIAILIAGLAVFGAGMGIVYYAALYYAMAVGRAGVDAGGMHEALIGCGYAAGPVAGLAAVATEGSTSETPWTLMSIAGVSLGIGLVGLLMAFRGRHPTH